MGALAIALLAIALPVSAFARLTIREEPVDADVFGGEPATLTVFVANQKGPTVAARLCTRFYRFNMERRWPAGGTRPWKKLTVPTDQTVLEKISITLPPAAASERYRVEIVDESGAVLGGVNVQAWPRKMLSELTDLNGGNPVGVFDSLGKFQKVLQKDEIPFADLTAEAALADFRGRLVILCGGSESIGESERYDRVAESLNKRGIAVIWLGKCSVPGEELEIYQEGKGGARCSLTLRDLDQLADSPTGQRRLIHCGRNLFHIP